MKLQLKQKGFTLIELVVVIVILGILAATALPKFIDLSTDAKKAKAQGFSGAIASSAAIRYAASQISGQGAYVTADACSGNYLQGGAGDLTAGNCSSSGTTSCTVTCDGQAAAAVTLP